MPVNDKPHFKSIGIVNDINNKAIQHNDKTETLTFLIGEILKTFKLTNVPK